MTTTLFLPTARQANWLLIIGFVLFGEALYLRYLGIENSQVALACQSGLHTWMCSTTRLTIWSFTYAVFGWTALRGSAQSAAPLARPVVLRAGCNSVRPRVAQYQSLRLGSCAFDVSLARPAPAPE